MLEVVRACLTSDELADTAEFFSFGTNDLTQGVFSFSREDVEGKFLGDYMDKGLVEISPFQSIDKKWCWKSHENWNKAGKISTKKSGNWNLW